MELDRQVWSPSVETQVLRGEFRCTELPVMSEPSGPELLRPPFPGRMRNGRGQIEDPAVTLCETTPGAKNGSSPVEGLRGKRGEVVTTPPGFQLHTQEK